MNSNSFLKNFGIHFIALAIFIIVGAIYFSPQLGGYGVKQHDIQMYKGMSNEAIQYREITGEEPMWTNSMFGGMPATQISLIHSGNLVKAVTNKFLGLFPIPLGAFLLHLICFYIFALFLRINPIIGIVGAFAFAFSSYEIIILAAGHNTKALAVAFLPAVLGAFIYAFKTNWKIGTALSALFMAFEISANHLQVTYYFGFLLLGLGIYYFIIAIKDKKLKEFGFATGGLVVAYGIALFINYGNIASTSDYAKLTTRGGTDLSIDGNGRQKIQNTGLELDYITQWSYGKSETFTFVSPYVKGSHSAALENSGLDDLAENLEFAPGEQDAIKGMSIYWGDQPMVAGPFYFGVIVIFMAFLALFFVKDKSIWVIFGVTLLAVLLSWGKNYMGLTAFFVNHVPGYNMFRTVTIVLVIVEMCVPIMAVLLLQRIYSAREEIAEKKKLFLIASGVFLFGLIVLKFSGDGFAPAEEAKSFESAKNQAITEIRNADPNAVMQQLGINNANELEVAEKADELVRPRFAGAKKIRKALYDKSTTRSLIFGFLTIGLCALFFYTSIPSVAIVGALGVLLLIDIVPVDRNYLGSKLGPDGELKHWSLIEETNFPVKAVPGDYAIMESELAENSSLAKVIKEGEKRGIKKAEELKYEGIDKRRVIDSYKFIALGLATDYRVYDANDGWSGTRAAYFHKSLGGYHGAKLRNIQNVFDFQIDRNGKGINPEILNIMNVKYIISNGEMSRNEGALGNAWAVKSVKEFDSPNDEIRALGATFKLTNVGSGEIYVNDEKVTDPIVYGKERMMYLAPGLDSLQIQTHDGIRPGTNAYMVVDAYGTANLMPEQSLAQDSLNSFTKIVKVSGEDTFVPSEEALMLKSEAKKLSKKQFTGEAKITMTSYKPNKLVYDVTSKGTQLVVFSEIYYPNGWKAFVDGKEQEILKVDYLLRGLELKDGKHKVEFVYDDVVYHKAEKFAYAGSTLLVLLVGGILFLEFNRRRKEGALAPTKDKV